MTGEDAFKITARAVSTSNLTPTLFRFISEFEHRINPLQLVEIVLPIAKFVFATS